MTVDWERLGSREKEVLAVLRAHEGSLATREVLTRLEDSGVDLAYTTVATVLDRLEDKGMVERDEELHAGSSRYRYRFDPAEHRESLVEDVLADVGEVLGEGGIELLARRAERERVRARSGG